MQYTLRNIPGYLDTLIRKKANDERKSINEVVIEGLERALGLSGEVIRYRNLEDLASTWKDDPDFDDAIQEQRTVDEALWK